jgi:hypothetical protein
MRGFPHRSCRENRRHAGARRQRGRCPSPLRFGDAIPLGYASPSRVLRGDDVANRWATRHQHLLPTDTMKNTPKKFWLILLIFIMCLLTLVLTSFAPLFIALQSKAKRLYPENTADLVNINQIFIYQLPAESRGFPFGLHCSSLSPSILEGGHSSILATTIHNGQIVGVLPDPVNNILLPPNSNVSVHITGECYLRLRPLGDIGLLEYSISRETFQVGESRYSQDDLYQLISNYIEDQFPPNVFEEIPLP